MGGLVWHVVHALFFESICWSPTYVNWAIVDMSYKSFLIRRPSSKKDRLFKWNECICHKIVIVHFDIIWESADEREIDQIPHDHKHVFFPLNIKSRLCDYVISRQTLHATWWYIQEKSWLILNCEIMPVITFGSMQEWQYRFCILLRFSCKLCISKYGIKCKWNNLKSIDLCKCSTIIKWAIHNVSTIEQSDLKGDLFNIAIILTSKSSRGGIPMRISSWKFWRPSRISAIQIWTVRNL
jgi:hypothetical protein